MTDGASNESRSDSPVPLDFPLNKCSLTIREKCGQCLHFKRMAYPPYKKPCIELGIIDESKPCKAFQSDISKIKFVEKKHVANVAEAIQELSTNDLRLLASVLNGEEKTRRYNFRFGEPLFFRAFGGDYLSNYVCASVLFADSRYVYVQGSDGCLASLYHSSVLKDRQWARKQSQLLRDNKQKDPNFAKYTQSPTKQEKDLKSLIDKVVPTLTSETNFNSSVTSTKAKTNTRTLSLDKLLVMR